MTVGSDASFRILMDKLPRIKIHGMDPIVTNFNRHYFSQFEEQARKEFPSTAGTPLNNANNEHHSQSSYSSNQQHQFYMSMFKYIYQVYYSQSYPLLYFKIA